MSRWSCLCSRDGRGGEDEVDELQRRGWQAALAPLVQHVRRQVAAALPEGDYLMLVRLLARLVDGLPLNIVGFRTDSVSRWSFPVRHSLCR